MSIRTRIVVIFAISLAAILASDILIGNSTAYIPGGIVGIPNMPDIVTKSPDVPGGVPGIPNISDGPAQNQGILANIFGP